MNADETGIQWMMGIKYQYVTGNALDSSAPSKEEKSRCVGMR
jgi:hypothetical protein